jgi:hypothetical protein
MVFPKHIRLIFNLFHNLFKRLWGFYTYSKARFSYLAGRPAILKLRLSLLWRLEKNYYRSTSFHVCLKMKKRIITFSLYSLLIRGSNTVCCSYAKWTDRFCILTVWWYLRIKLLLFASENHWFIKRKGLAECQVSRKCFLFSHRKKKCPWIGRR